MLYYYYIPKDGEIDETTPVVAYVTHGGGTSEDERAFALHKAAGQDTRAIFVIPCTDRPDAVCASIEDVRYRLNGKGNFAAISGHGTSSGGRAIMQAAVESVNPNADYGFRFANVFAYDPAEQTDTTNIREQSDALRRLAEQGTVFFIQTDTDSEGHGGSGAYPAPRRTMSTNNITAVMIFQCCAKEKKCPDWKFFRSGHFGFAITDF